MIKVILFDLRNVLFTFDPHKRVEGYIRLLSDRHVSEKDFGKVGKVVLGKIAQKLLKNFELGKISPRDFKDAMEKLLHIPEQPGEDFWKAHCAGFTLNEHVLHLFQEVMDKHPLLKLVAMGDMDRVALSYLLKLCGTLKLKDAAVSFMPGAGKNQRGFAERIMKEFDVSGNECLVLDAPEPMVGAEELHMEQYVFSAEPGAAYHPQLLGSLLKHYGLI